MSNLHRNEWAQSLWEKAEVAENQLRVSFETLKDAQSCRFALYSARNANRKLSTEVYQPEDLEYNTSSWDAFRVTIEREGPKGPFVVVIARHSIPPISELKIESL